MEGRQAKIGSTENREKRRGKRKILEHGRPWKRTGERKRKREGRREERGRGKNGREKEEGREGGRKEGKRGIEK